MPLLITAYIGGFTAEIRWFALKVGSCLAP